MPWRKSMQSIPSFSFPQIRAFQILVSVAFSGYSHLLLHIPGEYGVDLYLYLCLEALAGVMRPDWRRGKRRRRVKRRENEPPPCIPHNLSGCRDPRPYLWGKELFVSFFFLLFSHRSRNPHSSPTKISIWRMGDWDQLPNKASLL